MAREEVVKEFEAAQALQEPGTTPPAPASPQSPTTAPTTVEEIEVMLQGKPFRFPTNTEIPFKHNGQLLRQPLSGLLNSYRQGAHIEDKLKEYRALKEEVEKSRGDVDQFTELQKKYGAIQSWSESNPQEWERLYELFQNKDRALLGQQVGEAGPGMDPKLLDQIGALKKELGEMKSWKSTLEQREEQAQVAADVENVKAEIDVFKKEWPEIDLEEKNLDGLSLRALILQHGVKRGIGEFKLAAMDYLGPRLFETVSQRSRKQTVDAVKTDKQQGIVARSNQPFGGQGGELNPDKMTKQERNQAARSEYEKMLHGST
jgi:hypothetical protein